MVRVEQISVSKGRRVDLTQRERKPPTVSEMLRSAYRNDEDLHLFRTFGCAARTDWFVVDCPGRVGSHFRRKICVETHSTSSRLCHFVGTGGAVLARENVRLDGGGAFEMTMSCCVCEPMEAAQSLCHDTYAVVTRVKGA